MSGASEAPIDADEKHAVGTVCDPMFDPRRVPRAPTDGGGSMIKRRRSGSRAHEHVPNSDCYVGSCRTAA